MLFSFTSLLISSVCFSSTTLALVFGKSTSFSLGDSFLTSLEGVDSSRGLDGAMTGFSSSADFTCLGLFDLSYLFTGKKKFKELFSRDVFERLEEPKEEKKESKKEEKSQKENKPKKEEKKEEETKEPALESILVLNKRIQKLMGSEDRKVKLSKLQKMATDRKIDLKNQKGDEKSYKELIKEVAKYEARRYEENKVGYVHLPQT